MGSLQDAAAQQAYQAAKQQALAQSQLYQTTYSQGLANVAAQYIKPKEDPKNEFLEKVRKIYMKRVELKIRMAMFIGGMALFMFVPVIGYNVFRLWSWIGVGSPAREIGGVLFGLASLALSVTSFIMAFEGSFAKTWAREWVLENEAK